MEKRRMKPSAFLRRYGRIIIAGTVLFLIVLVALFANKIATHDPYAIDMYNAKIRPNEEHIMGTDIYGRDIFSRVVHGTRVSLLVSASVNILSIIIGTIIGLLAGFYKKIDKVIMRIMEGISALPMILLAIVLVSVLGRGAINIIISITIVNLPGIARLVRSQVLSIKQIEYIESARAMGASNLRIIFKYVLPQCLSPLIIRFTNGLGSTILTEASLSFLGAGLDPRIPSWGGIISEGKGLVMTHPYICAYPGFAIIITVLTFCILGDGVRDVLDPKLR
ncbi:putative peptide transporter permease subunit: membrane component of ABC superfamily [[Clostridium] ultunense Esp]|uniref:Putative peptide transporter permease subunit: membrane component of ABC superfamily n=3 Tax=Schnuerera ultunensis TaxID=45497 RepID=M1ZG69_9FIRM|nr:putative peptide transporter permease subunit: membrane component of ABC superfamily [[Clostridium] ultunense Esp]SHD75698.1 putative peptide transporter permease subunit: membrane component of ABC superfamily [[Clostridium] ultunense Esp]